MESEIFLVKKITALEKQRKLRPKSIIFVLSKESKTRETLLDYFISEWLLNGTFIFYCI